MERVGLQHRQQKCLENLFALALDTEMCYTFEDGYELITRVAFPQTSKSINVILEVSKL